MKIKFTISSSTDGSITKLKISNNIKSLGKECLLSIESETGIQHIYVKLTDLKLAIDFLCQYNKEMLSE